MSDASNPFRLGFFTRLVDDVEPRELYARALELFVAADELGFDTGWVAQHHAHAEGGLPSPLVFLAAAAARTTHLTVATGIVTLPLENPLRLAEDAAVLHALSGHRFELGFGAGGNEAVFSAFGREAGRRHDDYARGYATVRAALEGRSWGGGELTLFPPAPELVPRIWEATFGVPGAVRAAEHGSGLLLARTAVRPGQGPDVHSSHVPLGEAQQPMVDAYLDAWRHPSVAPRVGLSRSVYVAPAHEEAVSDAASGLRRHLRALGERSGLPGDASTEELLLRSYAHVGDPEEVARSLQADRLLPLASDLICQVHPIDPSHPATLRSLELLATEVAPALGWRPRRASVARRTN